MIGTLPLAAQLGLVNIAGSPGPAPAPAATPVAERSSVVIIWGDDIAWYNLSQRSRDLMDVGQEPFVELRLPKIFNLRMDPFERADQEAIGYGTWRFERLLLLVPAQVYVGNWLATLREFPPRQEAGSFSLSKVMDKLRAGASGGSK